MRGVGIAGAGLERHRLGNHAAQPLEPNEALHLADVTEGSRRDQHRILQTQTVPASPAGRPHPRSAFVPSNEITGNVIIHVLRLQSIASRVHRSGSGVLSRHVSSCRSRSELSRLIPDESSTISQIRQDCSRRRGICCECPNSSDLTADLEFVKALAVEAAAVAMERCRAVTPQEKANLSYVTDLDQDLEQLIRGRLGERFPDDVLTGEEYEAGGGTGPRRWSIDPIDGTGNLVHGLPLWAVSIGLIVAGEPVLGVIAIPPLNELFWAVKGPAPGSTAIGSPPATLDEFHNQDNVCVGTNALRAVDTRTLPGRLRDLGSACCEQTFVAANRLQATTMLGEQTHDIAAGVVIASEAGCQFATIDGRATQPSRNGAPHADHRPDLRRATAATQCFAGIREITRVVRGPWSAVRC